MGVGFASWELRVRAGGDITAHAFAGAQPLKCSHNTHLEHISKFGMGQIGTSESM